MDSQLFTFHIFLCSHFVVCSKQNVQFHTYFTNKHHLCWSARMFVYVTECVVWCGKKLNFFCLPLENRLCAMLFHHNIYDARTLNKECDEYEGKMVR